MPAETKNSGADSPQPKVASGCCCGILDKSSVTAILISAGIILAALVLNCCEDAASLQRASANPGLELTKEVYAQWEAHLPGGGKHPLIVQAKYRQNLNSKNGQKQPADFQKTLSTLTDLVKEEIAELQKDEYADPSELIIAMHFYVNVLTAFGEDGGNNNGLSGKFKLLCFEDAITVALELLEIQGLAIGLGHEDCYELRNKIGHLYELVGNYDQAITFWLYVVEFRGRTLGVDHKDTLEARRRIGVAFLAQGNQDRAHMELHQVYVLLEENYGAEHERTLGIQRDIAQALRAKGNQKKALEILRDLVEKQSQILGQNHPETILTKQSLDQMTK